MSICRVSFPILLSLIASNFSNTSLAAPADTAGFRKSVAAVRIEPADAPEIDGSLLDAAWMRATVIDDLKQVVPETGAPVSERTVIRILYDENNLYFGIYAYDRDPDAIIVRTMARDGELYTGDNVSIALDPGQTRRNAYNFQVGPSGGRNDSLFLNNSDELEEWDPIWNVSARVVEDGWVAEIAIPFQSLSYEADEADWGMEIRRRIRRKSEDAQWASQNPALDFTDVSQSGTLTGIHDIDRGLGLDVQVYGVVRIKRDWHIPGEDTGISGTAGGNIFYRITPSLTGTLTFNPDFSDRPLDARQINTTRFSLFFPETRDFFLQDAAAFEFGGRGFSRGFDRDANNGRPFFSRNIGLADREQVSVVGGGKLSGTLGGFSIGALSVLTGDTPTTSGQILSVARVTHPVFAESKVGAVVTNGDPSGQSDNTVAGADFQYRNSNFLGDNVFQSDFYFERSFSSTMGGDNTFGAAINFPNEPWGGEASFKQLGSRFEPALGFVNRTGIREFHGNIYRRLRFRERFLRIFEANATGTLVTNLRGTRESSEAEIAIEAESTAQYIYGIGVVNIFERVLTPFDVADLTVPAGRYDWTNIRATFETSEAERLSMTAEVLCCRFYGGDAVETTFELFYRPSAYFDFSAAWEGTFLDLPSGNQGIHVFSANATVNFTPNMLLDVQLQYDNVSRDLGLLSRYRWEFSPGNELFVAFGQAATTANRRFTAQRSEFSVRLGRTFRY